MYFGAHVSIAGGMDLSPKRAADWGCEVFQTFSRSPQGGPAPKLTPEIVKNFKNSMKEYDLKGHYIHTPYYINFASKNPMISGSTVRIIREELERGSLLGSDYVMTHLGSAKDVGMEKGMTMVVDGLCSILKDYKGSTQFLIEISAGSGETIGDTFEEIAEAIERTEKKLKRKDVVNVCFDTEHAFASGYDLRTPEAVKATFKKFDQTIGLKRLKMSHCNDSKVDLGKHVDRHENIGKGKLGLGAFKAIIANKDLRNMHLVLETPRDDKGTEVIAELKLLKKIRDGK